MSTRMASLQDLGLLTQLFEAYRHFYQMPPDEAGARAFLRARLERGESAIFLALETTGEAVGFTQLYPIFSSTRMRRMWLLNDLYVLPAFRGQGHSLALIDAAKQLCRHTDACGLLLETAKDNAIGNALYPRAGFALDEGHNYYFWEQGR
jgi:GNAT superfamily N-acetyltransferase